MSIGDWDEGTLVRFIEDAIQRDPVAGLARAMGMAGMRVVRGGVAGASGAVLLGTGFTSSRAAAGDYTVTFAPAFSGVPAVVALPVGGVVSAPTTKTAAAWRIICQNPSTGAFIDNDFYFTAIGPA